MFKAEIINSSINVNLVELQELIKRYLNENSDTQFFITNSLYYQLIEENESNIIWKEEVIDSFYYADKIEKAFIFCIKNKNDTITFQMHVAQNSLKFVQLTFFASKGILYQHNLHSMDKIVVISTDQ